MNAEEIEKEAKLFRINENDEHAYHGFIAGAEWAMPKWNKISRENESQYEATDSERLMILFEDGSICKYLEKWPIKTATHFFELSNPPEQ